MPLTINIIIIIIILLIEPEPAWLIDFQSRIRKLDVEGRCSHAVKLIGSLISRRSPWALKNDLAVEEKACRNINSIVLRRGTKDLHTEVFTVKVEGGSRLTLTQEYLLVIYTLFDVL